METAQINSPDDLSKLQRSPNDMAAWKHAQNYLRLGRHASALASYRKLVKQFPGVPQLWIELGVAAGGDLDFTQACQAFQRAESLASNDASLLVAIGLQYFCLRRTNDAIASLRHAVKVDPASVNARLRLSKLLEQSRKLDEAWDCIEESLARTPADGRMLYFKAFLLHRKGQDQEAEIILRDLLKSPMLPRDEQASACNLLAVIMDGFGQYGEALVCLAKAKKLRCSVVNTGAVEQAVEKANSIRRNMLAALKPEMLRRWRDESDSAGGSPTPALLGGHARSGTTLIEQILGAHPDILIFDEHPSFAVQVLAPVTSPSPALEPNLKMLDGLPSATRHQLRQRYFKSLLYGTEEDPQSKLLLDKNPFTTVSLPVWLRLFPLSKVIIALRDPRDVVISCYFQNIRAEREIVCFASLERTVKYYSDWMEVWLRMRDLGGFDWMETRYEEVVANLESEGRRITDFLGLEWHPSQAAYHETTRRKVVHSPTYAEVARPIYTQSVRRWEHYAEALAPAAGGLLQFCRAFGYS